MKNNKLIILTFVSVVFTSLSVTARDLNGTLPVLNETLLLNSSKIPAISTLQDQSMAEFKQILWETTLEVIRTFLDFGFFSYFGTRIPKFWPKNFRNIAATST